MQEITVILFILFFMNTCLQQFAADVEKCFAYLCLKMSHDTQQGYQIQKMLIRPISDHGSDRISVRNGSHLNTFNTHIWSVLCCSLCRFRKNVLIVGKKKDANRLLCRLSLRPGCGSKNRRICNYHVAMTSCECLGRNNGAPVNWSGLTRNITLMTHSQDSLNSWTCISHCGLAELKGVIFVLTLWFYVALQLYVHLNHLILFCFLGEINNLIWLMMVLFY